MVRNVIILALKCKQVKFLFMPFGVLNYAHENACLHFMTIHPDLMQRKHVLMMRSLLTPYAVFLSLHLPYCVLYCERRRERNPSQMQSP
jgi:hypothetical protein